MKKYILLKDLPNLSKGAIFEWRPYDSNHPDRGNPGCGCLILAWINGDCQYTKDGNWCGESYIFPGQIAHNKEWFKEDDFIYGQKISMGIKWNGRKIVHEGVSWIPEDEAIQNFNRILGNKK